MCLYLCYSYKPCTTPSIPFSKLANRKTYLIIFLSAGNTNYHKVEKLPWHSVIYLLCSFTFYCIDMSVLL